MKTFLLGMAMTLLLAAAMFTGSAAAVMAGSVDDLGEPLGDLVPGTVDRGLSAGGDLMANADNPLEGLLLFPVALVVTGGGMVVGVVEGTAGVVNGAGAMLSN